MAPQHPAAYAAVATTSAPAVPHSEAGPVQDEQAAAVTWQEYCLRVCGCQASARHVVADHAELLQRKDTTQLEARSKFLFMFK